ncbi:unnamed protein product [Alopecurus aequalis]
MAMPATSSSLLGSLLLLFLFSAVVHAGTTASAAAAPLDQLCGSLGGYYVTPEICTSALCVDPSACRSARSTPELAALATRLVAANATAVKASLESALALASAPAAAADAEATKGMRSCLELYAGAVPALRWAARSVAAGRYSGAREVLEAAQYVASGCAGMARDAALPRENDQFSTMAMVAHAVVASMSTA